MKKDKGLIHIYTGEGKGKTTAAIGLAVRALGQGKRVLFVQFFKEDLASSGEKDVFRVLKNAGWGIELLRSNCRHPIFTKEKTDYDKVKGAVSSAFNKAAEMAGAGGFDMLVLDEVMSAIEGGWLSADEVMRFLSNGARPPHLEVVLTGRYAPPEMARLADYVTEMLKIKHPFDLGAPARKGIEY